MAIVLHVRRLSDPLDANYTRSSASTVPTEVKRVQGAVVVSTRTAVLLYFQAVQQSGRVGALPDKARESRPILPDRQYDAEPRWWPGSGPTATVHCH
jgi:hypothetical protein